MKEERFVYGTFSCSYFLIREDGRKKLRLIVTPKSIVLLKVPLDAEEEKIRVFLKRKYLWIKKQLAYFEKFSTTISNKEYISGESHLYLGRQYMLKVVSGEDGVRLYKNRLVISTSRSLSDSKNNKKLLDSWYQERVGIIFKQRYNLVFTSFNYNSKPDLVVRRMEKRWGSFLPSGKVVLNPELIKSSKECIDYVLTHELCHVKHKNHTKEFYCLLESKIPNWKRVKENLELRFL